MFGCSAIMGFLCKNYYFKENKITKREEKRRGNELFAAIKYDLRWLMA